MRDIPESLMTELQPVFRRALERYLACIPLGGSINFRRSGPAWPACKPRNRNRQLSRFEPTFLLRMPNGR